MKANRFTKQKRVILGRWLSLPIQIIEQLRIIFCINFFSSYSWHKCYSPSKFV